MLYMTLLLVILIYKHQQTKEIYFTFASIFKAIFKKTLYVQT